MNKDHFKLEIIKLQTIFGKQHYPGPKIDRIWLHTKHLTNNQFSNIVDSLVDLDKAPGVSDFKSKGKAYRKQDCKKCYDTGWCVVYNKKQKKEKIFWCDCFRGIAGDGRYPILETRFLTDKNYLFVNPNDYADNGYDMVALIDVADEE